MEVIGVVRFESFFVQISCKEVEDAKARVMNMDMECGKKNPSV